jgi:Na+-transporting NADH:ubiquinone oxidoreductase subunit A
VNVKVKKGCNIRLTGSSERIVVDLPVDRVAYTLADFPYLKPKMLLKEGDKVECGTPLFCEKKTPEVVFVSPVAGVVEEIVRGDRRVLLEVIIKKEGEGKVSFPKLAMADVEKLEVESAKKALLDRGLWAFLKRRPFHKVALVTDTPANIFVTCLDSNPLAADPNFYLDGREDDFNAGIALLSRICPQVQVCLEGNEEPSTTFLSSSAETHRFSGIHPRGNLSVHIEKIAPVVRQEQVVWSIRAQEVVAMGKTLLSGEFDAERTIAWAGPAAEERKYYKTTLGASIAALPVVEGQEVRRISGSVLSGREMTKGAFLGFYDNTAVALKEGRERKLLGWLDPGLKAHSLTRCYVSSAVPAGELDLTTTANGEHRAIVDSEMYDKVQPLDIHTAFLFKSLLVADVEESERQGLWSVAPEDMALASYMDPSKNDFAAPLVNVLDMLHKEES